VQTTAIAVSAAANTERRTLRSWLAAHMPQIVLAPSVVGTFVYVFLFTAWTLYISMTDSTLLPSYSFVGLDAYARLWANHRWQVAYTNLFFFGVLYVVGSMALGLLLAVLLDQRIRGESFWRTIYLYPLAVSFVVTGTVWAWLLHPTTGIENFVHHLGWESFAFDWIINRDRALYTIVITGFWQASGFCMVLFLAGLRSVDHDLIKAAQIDGASMGRIYRKVIFPAMRPISIAVMVVLLQYAIKTFDLVLALTSGGPGISTVVPAIVVYDFMFQRGLIAQGAAAAIMILCALAVVLVPYAFWLTWRRNREAVHV
jgi:glucose/mannose transport system permease protein